MSAMSEEYAQVLRILYCDGFLNEDYNPTTIARIVQQEDYPPGSEAAQELGNNELDPANSVFVLAHTVPDPLRVVRITDYTWWCTDDPAVCDLNIYIVVAFHASRGDLSNDELEAYSINNIRNAVNRRIERAAFLEGFGAGTDRVGFWSFNVFPVYKPSDEVIEALLDSDPFEE